MGGVLAAGVSHASEAVPDTYSGPYIGGGLNHQYTIGDALLDDNLDASNMFTDDMVDAHGLGLVSSKVGTIGATITTGYGIFDSNYYIGADLCVDITGNKNHNQTHYSESKIRTDGVIPTIALRFGRFFSSIDCLMYTRFGFTFLRNEFQNYKTFKTNFRCQSISPIVGLGLEKMVLDRCSLRFEGDYRFPADKKKHDIAGWNDNGDLIDGYKGSIENRTRGYAVRFMCVYHF